MPLEFTGKRRGNTSREQTNESNHELSLQEHSMFASILKQL